MTVSLLLLVFFTTLASYRTWRLIAVDDIPFGGVRSRIKTRWAARRDGTLYIEGLSCPWCLGSLISFAYVGSLAQVTSIPLPGLIALAVACGVGLLSRLDDV